MKKGKILITGAAGFIGTNIFEHLKNKGYDVYGVAVPIQANSSILPFMHLTH